MHTGFISFCDRICNNIKSLDTKDVILAEMESRFGIQILQKHWHRLDDKGVQHIIRVPHLACLRSNGNPYYIFFTRYEDIPVMLYVDKKVQPGYQKPRMVVGRGQWNEELSEGTIFDGEMVKTTCSPPSWIFLINDMIAYKGKLMEKEHLPERLQIIGNILDNKYKPDATMDVCSYQVKRYAHATQDGTNSLIELSKELPYTNRGVYYWPFSSKYKPKLHNFDDSLVKTVSLKVKDTPDFRLDINSSTPSLAPTISTVTNPNPNPTTSAPASAFTSTPAQAQASLSVTLGEGECVLWLRKTEYPDVFDVYPADNGIQSGNKLGVAYVKTLEDSRYLRDIFRKATVTVCHPFRCKKDIERNKWIPIELASH